MSGTHAPIAISHLQLTEDCNASSSLEALVAELPETEEEAEGTAAHLVMAAHASGNPWPVGVHFESNGKPWTVDTDMVIGAKMFVTAMGGPHGNLRVEDGVRASVIHPEHCYGTPDAWRRLGPRDMLYGAGTYAESTGRIVTRVGDYKYGHHFVEVFENRQLIGYGLGVIERLNLIDTDVLFEFILVQPRCYHKEGPVRVWRVKAEELRPIVNSLSNAAHAALGLDPTATTGNHCLDCRARGECKTLQHHSGQIVEYVQRAEHQAMTPDQMGVELRIIEDAAKILEARMTGLRASVEATLNAGGIVPMWMMEKRKSALKWLENTTAEDRAAAFDLLGVNVRKPLDTLTPRQAIDSGIDESIITPDYAVRPPGGFALKRDKSITARKIFGAHYT
jgi:hypothetical protein